MVTTMKQVRNWHLARNRQSNMLGFILELNNKEEKTIPLHSYEMFYDDDLGLFVEHNNPNFAVTEEAFFEEIYQTLQDELEEANLTMSNSAMEEAVEAYLYASGVAV